MESYLMITQINDFIFCPRSLLFHDFFYVQIIPRITFVKRHRFVVTARGFLIISEQKSDV